MADARYNKYVVITLIMPLIVVTTIVWRNITNDDDVGRQVYPSEIVDLINFQSPCPNEFVPNFSLHSYIRRDYNVVVAVFFIGFMLVATYSLVLAFKRLVRKGVSKSARASFFGKHLSYVVVILMTW